MKSDVTHPDDATVVRAISERMERTYADYLTSVCSLEDYQQTQRCLISLDAIRPVLAKLTPEEWNKLTDRLMFSWLSNTVHPAKGDNQTLCRYVLTLAPPILARAVAEAILACRKEGGG